MSFVNDSEFREPVGASPGPLNLEPQVLLELHRTARAVPLTKCVPLAPVAKKSSKQGLNDLSGSRMMWSAFSIRQFCIGGYPKGMNDRGSKVLRTDWIRNWI